MVSKHTVLEIYKASQWLLRILSIHDIFFVSVGAKLDFWWIFSLTWRLMGNCCRAALATVATASRSVVAVDKSSTIGRKPSHSIRYSCYCFVDYCVHLHVWWFVIALLFPTRVGRVFLFVYVKRTRASSCHYQVSLWLDRAHPVLLGDSVLFGVQFSPVFLLVLFRTTCCCPAYIASSKQVFK